MDRTDILIRPYAPADLDAVMTLFARAVREIASRNYTPAQIKAWAEPALDRAVWTARLDRRPTFVAVRNGAIAGFSDLEADGRIDMMFVHPDHQRRGVASALLGHVEALARAQGHNRLFTEASITARPLFERFGFRVVAAQTVERRGQRFINYRMERIL